MAGIGPELRRRRKAAGLTQAALAALAGCDASSISEWENEVRDPEPESLRRVAPHLGVSYQHFLTFGKPYDPNGPKETKRQRETNTQMLLDSAAEAGRLPAQVTKTEGGFLGMLFDDEQALVGNYRLAKRINPDEAAALLAAAADIATGRRSLLGKSPRHSGGKA